MNKLLIDIDTKPFNRREFDKKVMLLCKELGAKYALVTLASTKHGTHAYVEIYGGYSLLAGEIVASQLFLGSDPARELFNLGRVIKSEDNWNVLFKAKWKKGELVSKESNIRGYKINTKVKP